MMPSTSKSKRKKARPTRTVHLEGFPVDLIARARAKCAASDPPQFLKYVIRDLLEDWLEGYRSFQPKRG